jgi:hypothetical protein
LFIALSLLKAREGLLASLHASQRRTALTCFRFSCGGDNIGGMPKPRSSQVAAVDPKTRALVWLNDHGSPRMVMSLMLASTIGCGFLASVSLHRVGLAAPLIRYPLAVLAAWAVFLALVSVWVWWERRRNDPAGNSRSFFSSNSSRSSSSSSGIDLPGGGKTGSSWRGGGGRFGGGGASESFADAPGDASADASSQGLAAGFLSGSTNESSASGGRSVGGGGGGSGGGKGGFGVDVGGDGDFVILLIAIIAVAAAVFGVVFYAVYSAPTFFAELLIDGGVGTWLYKRANVADRPDWLNTAVRRSVWPVVILLVVFVALAVTMRHVAPGSTTLGEAWSMVRAGQ